MIKLTQRFDILKQNVLIHQIGRMDEDTVASTTSETTVSMEWRNQEMSPF